MKIVDCKECGAKYSMGQFLVCPGCYGRDTFNYQWRLKYVCLKYESDYQIQSWGR